MALYKLFAIAFTVIMAITALILFCICLFGNKHMTDIQLQMFALRTRGMLIWVIVGMFMIVFAFVI